ncbi:hypothetical protein QJS04_geneDACA004635 [Acorus gramineus]|uniref:YTH domain-containing family protein n=1 Tax=Acorus gramineus TaxID=55184 RepID=A0AAV9BS52_ACOGR|nr:hypothetical protein QJS04_geneDACA004635 [Acorus gramineus]
MPDIIPKHTPTAASAVVVGPTKKSASGNARKDSALAASHQLHAANLSKGSKVDSALAASHQPVLLGTTSRTASYPIPSQVTQNRSVSASTQVANHFSQGNLSSVRDHQIKVPVPANDGFVDVASNGWEWMAVDKFRPRLQYGMTNGNASLGMLSEQNRSPRTNRSKGQWASSISSKSYIPRTGANNVQENSIIYADQFNKDDFSVNYPNAKFFVIKSYSEDDVHKSIKYNVWSSTPSGNRKLAAAYEDAHQISAGNPKDCPIFLFFSVNASGQFCGVAEMVGPVDFHKDMDFWQQDKWTGSFPVKWHIVKDVPNASFRHIILENNENKPVTNSRDTQEVPYVQGITMLNMFKYNPLKTSLLDVFVYYEERQKIMQEEKSRFLGGTYDGSFFTPSFIPSNKPNGIVEPLLTTEEKPVEYNGMGKTNDTVDHPQKTEEKHVEDTGDDLVISEADGDDLESERKGMKLKYAEDVVTKIGSLSIESKDDHTNRDALEDVVIVGTIPVKANGFEGKSP